MSSAKKLNRVVVDASPIIGLAILDLLHLLWELFEEVFVPHAVYCELVEKPSGNQFGKTPLLEAAMHGNIKIYKVTDTDFIQKYSGKLHRGELETIVAAKELNAEYLLLDEKTARTLAKTFMLEPTGLIGILRIAKRTGKIKQLKPLLDKLIESKFRISPQLYTAILTEEGE